LSDLKYQAVAALLEANSQLTTMRDSFGRTPMHLACMFYDGDDDKSMITKLMESDTSVISMQDVEGRTPVHLLLMRGKTCSELVQKLVNACPAVIGLEDAVRETPIDICMRQNSSLSQNAEGDNQELLQILKAVPKERCPRTAWRKSIMRACHT
jgi:ankyrin repeat protein